MAENIKHFPVNWIDGMKINKKHFKHEHEGIVKNISCKTSWDISSVGPQPKGIFKKKKKTRWQN